MIHGTGSMRYLHCVEIIYMISIYMIYVDIHDTKSAEGQMGL